MKKSMLTKTLALALTGALAVGFMGCGKTEDNSTSSATKDGKTKLKMYVDYADEDTKAPYDYALAALKKEMPDVEIDMEPSARDDGQKLKTYAQTGNMPDIFQVGVDQINIFKNSNNILQLDKYSDDFKKKLQPNSENLLVHPDGHVYAFPFAGKEYAVLYYNKDVFAKYNVKVPTTYDELMTAVKTFKSNNIVPLSIFAKEKWPCVALFDMFATRMDGQGIMKLDAGKGTTSETAYSNAAKEIVDLVKAGLIQNGATNTNYDQAASLFYQGKAAMFLNGQWEIEASTKNLGDKVDWMYIPAPDAASYETGKTAWSGGGSLGGFAVSANTKNKDVAAKVASFMALKYAECKYTQRANPFVATVVDKAVEKQYPAMMDKLAKQIPNVKTTTGFDWHLTNAKFKASIEDNTQRLLTGTYSADQFVKDMDKTIKEATK